MSEYSIITIFILLILFLINVILSVFCIYIERKNNIIKQKEKDFRFIIRNFSYNIVKYLIYNCIKHDGICLKGNNLCPCYKKNNCTNCIDFYKLMHKPKTWKFLQEEVE